MNPICNILVIADPTATTHPSIEKGALLAERFGARLELFICDTKASRNARLLAHAQRQSTEPLITDLKAVLDGLAAPLRERGLDVTAEVVSADPLHIALVDRVKKTSAELVIKDTHHHSLAQRTFLTNTDWELIRGCPVPLLLTKSRSWAAQPRVFAAIDPGHVNDKPILLDHRILEQASTLAKRLSGEVHVVHAFLPMSVVAAGAASPPMGTLVTAEDLIREHDATLKEVMTIVSDYGVTAERVYLEAGGAAEVITRVARERSADILVAGAISRAGLKRIFIGSTAEDVLERLPCDVLVVKTPNFAELMPF